MMSGITESKTLTKTLCVIKICNCENYKYVESTIDNSVIRRDEIMDAVTESYNNTKNSSSKFE